MRIRLSLVPRALAAAALATMLLAPAAAGSRASPHVKLSVLPLPKSAIGSVARPLQLSHFSGAVTNGAAAGQSMSGSVKTFVKLGRVSGYLLDYGVAASGGAGVTDVLTSVERYKSSAAAKRGLAFWRKDDALLSVLDNATFSVTNSVLKVPAVGKARFAYLTSYSAANIVPLFTVDERILAGKYVLQVQVSAGTAAAASTLAPTLAKKLNARLQQALHGRLHAKPVTLPKKQKPGPAPRAPDLTKLALKTSDFPPGSAVIAQRGWTRDPGALSCYEVFMTPAGSFDVLYHGSEWYATANQANFEADWLHALVLSDKGTVPLDLSTVGHGAQGVLQAGSSGYAAEFSLTVGQLDEFVIVMSETVDIQPEDMLILAQTLADRLDPIYTG